MCQYFWVYIIVEKRKFWIHGVRLAQMGLLCRLRDAGWGKSATGLGAAASAAWETQSRWWCHLHPPQASSLQPSLLPLGHPCCFLQGHAKLSSSSGTSPCFGKQHYQGMVNTGMQRARVTALGSWDSLCWPWVMGTFIWLSWCSINAMPL